MAVSGTVVPRRNGFTLIELTAVIAILGILAAASIGGMGVYLRSARASEATTNLHAIAALLDTHPSGPIACEASPPDVPRGQASPWIATDGFRQLGFQGPTEVRFQYSVEVFGEGANATYVVRARGDLDGDGQTSLYEMSSVDREVVAMEPLE